MPRRPNYRAIHRHLNYTVDELAREIGVCKGSVRRWIKAGMPVVSECRPVLIRGRDAALFLSRRRKPKQTCRLNEFPCFHCRAPQEAAGAAAEIVSRRGGTYNLRARCCACGTVMHKRVSQSRIGDLRAFLAITTMQADASLSCGERARLNVHFGR